MLRPQLAPEERLARIKSLNRALALLDDRSNITSSSCGAVISGGGNQSVQLETFPHFISVRCIQVESFHLPASALHKMQNDGKYVSTYFFRPVSTRES